MKTPQGRLNEMTNGAEKKRAEKGLGTLIILDLYNN